MAYLHIEESGGDAANAGSDEPGATPTALLVGELGEIQSDIANLYELLDVLFDEIAVLDLPNADAAKSRVSALAWIARDIAERAVADFEANIPILIKADQLVREAAEGGR